MATTAKNNKDRRVIDDMQLKKSDYIGGLTETAEKRHTWNLSMTRFIAGRLKGDCVHPQNPNWKQVLRYFGFSILNQLKLSQTSELKLFFFLFSLRAQDAPVFSCYIVWKNVVRKTSFMCRLKDKAWPKIAPVLLIIV